MLIISNPVNSTVPIAYETLRRAGVTAPSVLGITTLDVCRAQTFIGGAQRVDPRGVRIQVVGGHSGPQHRAPLFDGGTRAGARVPVLTPGRRPG